MEAEPELPLLVLGLAPSESPESPDGQDGQVENEPFEQRLPAEHQEKGASGVSQIRRVKSLAESRQDHRNENPAHPDP